MARLFTSGFEENSITNGVEFTATSNTPSVVTSPVRTGTYAGAITTVSSGSPKYFQYQFRSADDSTDTYVRTYLYLTTYPDVATSIMGFVDSIGNISSNILLSPTGTLEVHDNSGGIVGLASAVQPKNTWLRVEHRQFNTSSIVELKINGTVIATTSAGSTAVYQKYQWGANLGADAATVINIGFDDLAINDTTAGTGQTGYPGAGQVVVLRPNAAGDNNAFTTQTGGTAGAANNYTRVNEVTPDDVTTFNGANVTGNIDDLNIDNTPGSIGASDTISLVQVNVRFRASVASAVSIFRTARIKKAAGGTVSNGPTLTPNSTTWKTNANAVPNLPPITLYVDPDGGAWTKATLDTAQIGYGISTGNTNRTDVSAIWLTVESVPVSGTLYTSSLTGALSFVGAQVRTTKATRAAALSFVGSQAKATSYPLMGALSFVGSLPKRTSRTLVGAGLSFLGAIASLHQHFQALTATLSFSGSVSKRISKALPAGLSFIGAFSKLISYPLTAALSFSGSVFKNTSRAVSGALNFVGGFAGSHLRVMLMVAGLSFSGAFNRQTNKLNAGGVSFVGALTKRISRALSSGLSFVGSMAKQVGKAVSAALNFIGNLAANLIHGGGTLYTQALTAGLSFSGAFTKRTSKSVIAAASFIGALAKGGFHTLTFTASLSLSGTVNRSISKSFVASLGWLGSFLNRWIPGHPYTVSPDPASGAYSTSTDPTPSTFTAQTPNNPGSFSASTDPASGNYVVKPDPPPGTWTPSS